MGFDIGGMLGFSNSTSTTSSVQDNSGTSKSSGSTTRFDTQNKQLLDQITQLFGSQVRGAADENALAGSPDYTKDKAIADSQGIVGSIFNQFKSQALPSIYNAQSGSGGYGSTGAQMLSDYAFGQATTQASEAVMNNIKNYADITNQQSALRLQQGQQSINSLLAAFGLQAQAVENTSQNTETHTASKGASTTNAKSVNGSLKGGYSGG